MNRLTITATARQIADTVFAGYMDRYRAWRDGYNRPGHFYNNVSAYDGETGASIYPLGHGRWQIVGTAFDGQDARILADEIVTS